MMYEAAAEASPTANPNVIIERRRQIHRQPATSSNFLHVNGPSALKEQKKQWPRTLYFRCYGSSYCGFLRGLLRSSALGCG
jgi:hypothetical protein